MTEPGGRRRREEATETRKRKKPLFDMPDETTRPGASPRSPQPPATRQQQQQHQQQRPAPRPPAPARTPPKKPRKPLFDLPPDDDPPPVPSWYDEDEDVPPRAHYARRHPDETERLLHQARYHDASRTFLAQQPNTLLYEAIPIRPVARSSHMLRVGLVAILSVLVLLWLGPASGNTTRLSRWIGTTLAPISQSIPFLNALQPPPPQRQPGDYNLQAAPSLSAEQIDAILASYGSPATGTGQAWVDYGTQHNIDPAFALAFFIHESTAGTHPNWAGLKDDGSSTHNVGNIICAGYPTCYGRFRDYDSWETGIADWYRLIDVEYIQGRGTTTLDEIIPIYAPSVENDVDGYTAVVKQMVDSWRTNSAQGRGLWGNERRPTGNPLRAENTVMTQGYNMGSHAPANVWGAVDLAIDSDHNGSADPDGSWGQPVYATHGGIVRVRSNTWPAGNHVWVINNEYKTGYAHLESFAVTDGQVVNAGDLIGTMGSSGQSSGPHLDYQVWHFQHGQWVNQNPLDYGVLMK